jgi:hypothetical protein
MTYTYRQVKPIIDGLEATCVKRLEDNAFIPFDPANTDYQAFLKYQAEGGKVYGADEEVPDGQAAE